MLRSLRLMLLAWLFTALGRLRGQPRHSKWSFAFEVLVRFLRLDWEETASFSSEKLRADLNARPYPAKFLKKVKLTEVDLGGVPAWRFMPPAAATRRCVLFFHGGSYIFGSARTTHAELLARLAYESGVEVVGVDYRLAPEHPYPSQLEDALTAFERLVSSGIAPHRILLAGDSAGAHLATILQIALRDRKGPQVAGLALSSPWVNLEMRAASFQENEPYDYGTREVLRKQALAFAGGTPLLDPNISPVQANLRGLAPCLVTVGDLEILRDDILEFSRRLQVAGVEHSLHVAKDMPNTLPSSLTIIHQQEPPLMPSSTLFASA